MIRGADRAARRKARAHWLKDRLAAALLGGLSWLPYGTRLSAMGWVGRAVLGPAKLNRKIRGNLALVMPELPESEIRAICRAVGEHAGRMLGELHAGAEFARRAAQMPIIGAGLAALEQARLEGRPVILASGHFGNYDAVRSHLAYNGYRFGGLYRPMSNPAANRRYVALMEAISSPLFATTGQGMAEMVRFLRGGGVLGVLTDLNSETGIEVDFLGHPALVALSTAKMALKNNALLLPIYATREPDGVSFVIEVEAPVPHTDPRTMTRTLIASLEARIRAAPGQWLYWSNRRWRDQP